MGKLSLGVGLLAVLLVLGLWVGGSVQQIHGPVAESLEQAAAAALRGDAEQAYGLLAEAKTDWERCRSGIAAVADHGPMDEIESLFEQAANWQSQGKLSEFSALCARLSRLVRAMGEAHSLTWWNIL